MTSKLTQIEAFHNSFVGYLTFGIIELALGYGFVSWAIDSGSLLDWFLAVVLLIGGLQNLIKLTWKYMPHGRKD